MYLIVGLGNPEEEYSRTRHNMGFDVVNKLAEKYKIKINKSKFQGLYGTGEIENKKVILLKPQTYMNASGESIIQFAKYYKIETQDILIVYDDVDIETGIIKIRKKGGPGTHNGMKSVVYELKSENFPRVRIGTGKNEKIVDMMSYVIEKVNDKTYNELEIGVNKGAEAISELLKNGTDSAMNKFN